MSDSPQRFENEGNAYERAGFPGVAAMLGTAFTGGAFGELQKHINKLVQEPEERFAIYVDAISRSFNGRQGVTISEDDIVAMLMKIRRLQYVDKKNPTAYILGYLASNGGSRMDKKRVNEVITKILIYSEDSSVLPPDVIRYARLWMTLG